MEGSSFSARRPESSRRALGVPSGAGSQATTVPLMGSCMRWAFCPSAQETMTEYTPGAGFAYELRDFTDVFGRLVEGIRGEWTFTPDGDGCVVRWTWEFKPKRGRRLLLAGIVVPLFRRYMQRVMDASVALAEREALAAR